MLEGSRFRVKCLEFRGRELALTMGLKAGGFWLRVEGSGFRIQGGFSSGFRV